MGYQISYKKLRLKFKVPSGTSRGVLTEKRSWILSVHTSENPELVGKGECSIIEGLSPDYESDRQYEALLDQLIKNPQLDLSDFPSIQFGFESALLDLENGAKGVYFDNAFTRGINKIPINGLVWMGGVKSMQKQIEEKIKSGFTTIKMKVGAIQFEKELALLESIRKRYSSEEITLRVDANGAFAYNEALPVLTLLADLDIHSIEQPIKAGQWEAMAALCERTPTPIALDEELIGISNRAQKLSLLNTIHPQFIILKPSLHGGIAGVQDWIRLAEERNIGWWMTSALESNIALSVIAQFTGEYNNSLPHGLGTGGLYSNNLPSNLVVDNGFIFYR